MTISPLWIRAISRPRYMNMSCMCLYFTSEGPHPRDHILGPLRRSTRAIIHVNHNLICRAFDESEAAVQNAVIVAVARTDIVQRERSRKERAVFGIQNLDRDARGEAINKAAREFVLQASERDEIVIADPDARDH